MTPKTKADQFSGGTGLGCAVLYMACPQIRVPAVVQSQKPRTFVRYLQSRRLQLPHDLWFMRDSFLNRNSLGFKDVLEDAVVDGFAGYGVWTVSVGALGEE